MSGTDLGLSLSVGGGIGSFQKGNLRARWEDLDHTPYKLPTAATGRTVKRRHS